MGSGAWKPGDWATYSATTSAKPAAAIFTSRGMNADLDPKGIIRESCDSPSKPGSTPIILCSDVTGSMGHLAELIIKTEMGKIMGELYSRGPVSDPHLLIAANGDVYSDRAPLQVTQFEVDLKLAEQMEKFFIEGNGGGNDGESYNIVWYFAEYMTRCDAITKNGRKGYLFTIGDEPPLLKLPAEAIHKFLGGTAEADISSADLFAAVSQHWHVFHLIVKPTNDATRKWRDLIGQHAIEVSDYTKMGEVIVSTIQVMEGEDAGHVAASWSGDTSLVVAKAVGGLVKASGDAGGVVRL